MTLEELKILLHERKGTVLLFAIPMFSMILNLDECLFDIDTTKQCAQNAKAIVDFIVRQGGGLLKWFFQLVQDVILVNS